jgi:hypothetical protein
VKPTPITLGLLALALVACGQSPFENTIELDPYSRLVQSRGGEIETAYWLEHANDNEIRLELSKFGISFEHDTVTTMGSSDATPQAVDGCPVRFDAADRNKMWKLAGNTFYIDSQGRPKSAFRFIPPITAGKRDSTCQAGVAKLGPGGTTNFDGGHLVGTQFGGWGKRLNLVPQNISFNRGNWLQVENAFAKCNTKATSSVLYKVTVTYDNATTNVPSTFRLDYEFSGKAGFAVFKNANDTTSFDQNTALRKQVVADAQKNGCADTATANAPLR